MLKKLFWIVVAIYLVFLVLINSQDIPFRYVYGESTPVKLDLIILISFAAGILSVFISNFISQLQNFFSEMMSYPETQKVKKLEGTLKEALKHIELENFAKAKELLVSYLKNETGNIDVYLHLAGIYLKENALDEAEDVLKRASIISKRNTKILNMLCDVYVQSKRFDKAINIYKEIMEKEEDKSLYQKKIYDVYVALKDYKTAYKIIKELSRDKFYRDYKSAFLLTKYNLALTYIKENNLNSAEDLLKEIIKEDSCFYSAYVSYSDVLIKKGDQKEAVEFLKESYDDTKFSYFAKLIEEIYLNEETPQKALLFYQNQLDKISLGATDSKGVEAWQDSQALILYALFINLLLKLEMIDYATEAVSDIVGTDDDKRVFHLFLAECQMRHGKFSDAAKQYQDFLKARRRNPIAFKCGNCGEEHEEFKAACTKCGAYNKINYFIS